MKIRLLAALALCLILSVAFPSYGEIKAGEEWGGIYIKGNKVGYVMSRLEKTGNGISITDESYVSLSMLGATQEMREVTVSDYDGTLGLKGFKFRMTAGGSDTNITGSVVGSSIKLVIETMGSVQEQEIQFKEKPHMEGDIEPYLIMHGLKAGKKYRLPIFDPATLSIREDYITVEAREDMKLGGMLVPTYRVRDEYAGITATSWINPDTGTVKGLGPMDMTFLRETKEQAMGMPEGGYRPMDLTSLTTIKATGIHVDEPRQVNYFKVRLSGADLSSLDVKGGRQVFKKGILTVAGEDVSALEPVKLPVSAQDLDRFLAPEPFIQSDDPKIVAKAKEITSGEDDALKAAGKICDWVYRSMEKKVTGGIPNADEVLRTLSGDCNEHTVLFTALARAAGIPARMNGGVVLMDGSFYYHAWPEIYAGRWVAVDPTFGQFPADATHIRLIQGGLDRYVDVVKLFGKLKVEVLEYR